jgi:molybdate transport system regulatory protein
MSEDKKNVKNINDLLKNINFKFKVWLSWKGEEGTENILGEGWANLLQKIKNNEGKSLLKAAESCNYSYKYAWSILKRIENRTGMSPVIIGKGGKGGGGWVKLNKWGIVLLESYNTFKNFIQRHLKNYLLEIRHK